MSSFKYHVLMSSETVKTYVLTKTNIFAPDAILEVTEIGDGNINYVFLVKEEKTGKSVVVKQADTLL
ncbi:MAG: S-methyl-5-thioribose kinase, partial [Vagococcus sp.]